MKSPLIWLSLSILCLVASIPHFERMTQLRNSDRLLAVGGIESYARLRTTWLKRCLALAEAIEDPDIRFQEIESLNRQLDEIDQESTVELGPELQIDRIIESRYDQRSEPGPPEIDPSTERRSAHWPFRKAKRKLHPRGGSRYDARRVSSRSDPPEPMPWKMKSRGRSVSLPAIRR